MKHDETKSRYPAKACVSIVRLRHSQSSLENPGVRLVFQSLYHGPHAGAGNRLALGMARDVGQSSSHKQMVI